MPTTTANLGLTLPTPNVDTGWGSTLNTDFTLIDNLFALGGNGTSVGLNIGSGKTIGIGGTLLLGSGDGTGTVTAPTIRGAARTGTNVTGPNITIDAANGTGTGGSGGFIFRTAPAGAAGTTANTMRNAFVIDNNGNASLATSFEAGGYINAAEYSASAGAGGRVNFNATTAAGTSTTIAFAKGLLTNGSASFAGDLGFYTSVSAAYNERMRIAASGAVSFNGASAYGTSGQVLTSNGNAPPTWNTLVVDSVTLLGTISTPTGSGQTVTLSGINLTGCKFVYAICENVDPTASTTTNSQFALGGANIRNATVSGDNYVIFDLTFSMAIVYSITGMAFAPSTLTAASTSISATTAPGSFQGGTIRLYSVR